MTLRAEDFLRLGREPRAWAPAHTPSLRRERLCLHRKRGAPGYGEPHAFAPRAQ
jgi:hypothetical protein